MDPDKTTTIGEGDLEITESPFHIMKAVERMSAKLRIWEAACLGFPKALSMMAATTNRRYWGAVFVKIEGAAVEKVSS